MTIRGGPGDPRHRRRGGVRPGSLLLRRRQARCCTRCPSRPPGDRHGAGGRLRRSGKSTIIGLIAAFTSRRRDAVHVDGVDLLTVRLSYYRTQLGVVLAGDVPVRRHDPGECGVRAPEATTEQILAACRIARVDEFAEKFEKQYETLVGERGVKLSGGQRQRVSIARAILADPRILILDEATSSLDSESEAAIQDGLAYLMQGRTTFVIAHRLSTVRRADQILVVDAGRIVECGTHESLSIGTRPLLRPVHPAARARDEPLARCGRRRRSGRKRTVNGAQASDRTRGNHPKGRDG